MYERFTERARHVVVRAQEVAVEMKHSYIGTGHIVYGLAAEHEGLASRVMEGFDLSDGLAHDWLKSQPATAPDDEGTPTPERSAQLVPFTPRAKRALEMSLREALALGHNYIGTEHVLLGLCRVKQGVGWDMLKGAPLLPDQDPEAVYRNEVVRLLSGAPKPKSDPPAEKFNALEVDGSLRLAIAEMTRAITQATQAMGRDQASSVKTFTEDADGALDKAAAALRRARVAAEG